MTPLVLIIGPARSGKDTAASAICERFNGISVPFADPIKRFLLNLSEFGGWQVTEDHLWGDKKQEVVERSRFQTGTEVCQAFARAMNLEREAMVHPSIERAIMRWIDRTGPKATARHLMQTFGTECVREVHHDYWVSQQHSIAQALLIGDHSYNRIVGLHPSPGKRYDVVCAPDGRFRNEVVLSKFKGAKTMKLIRVESNAELSATEQQHASETEQSSIPDYWSDAIVHNNCGLEAFKRRVTQAFENFHLDSGLYL